MGQAHLSSSNKMTNEQIFGDYLRQIIRASGIPIPELAEKCGVKRSTLYYYMTGDRTPSKKTVERLCEILVLSPKDTERMVIRKRAGRPRKPVTLARHG